MQQILMTQLHATINHARRVNMEIPRCTKDIKKEKQMVQGF